MAADSIHWRFTGKRDIRWGIIGTGRIACDFARCLQATVFSRLLAVASRSLDSAAKFATSHGVERFYGTYEELLRDEEVEIIYISTPHTIHFKWAKQALEHGKAVLVEKPFTINAKEAEILMRTARERKLFLMEGMWTRFFPMVSEAKSMVSEGVIGDVRMVQASFGFLNDGSNQRILDPALGGGSLLDVGVYTVSFASMIFGSAPTQITAIGQLTSDGIDKQVGIVASYGTNQLAILSSSIEADLPREAFIVGTKGTIKLHKPFWCPTKLTLELEGGDHDVIEAALPSVGKRKSVGSSRISSPSHSSTSLASMEETQVSEVAERLRVTDDDSTHLPFNFLNSQGLCYEIMEVNRCLQEGKLESDIMPLAESHQIMRTLDEIREKIGLTIPESCS